MPHRVTVIGGGVAGLSAATALSARGVHVTLLEARSTPGGRCSTFTDPATGERVDNGQHVLIGCYHETFRFLHRIGSGGQVRAQDTLSLRIVDGQGVSSVLRCPAWPAPLHLLGGLLGWTALTWRDRLSSLRILPALAGRASPAVGRVSPDVDRVSPDAGRVLPDVGRVSPDVGRLSPDAGRVLPDVGRVLPDVGRVPLDPADPSHVETVRQWLRRHGQSQRLIEVLWEPLAIAALNQPIDSAAAGLFREVVRRMFTTNRGDSTLVLPIVPLADLFVSPAVALLRRNGCAVLESAPAKIVMSGKGSGSVVQARDARLEGDAIVCAVPWFALPDVLPDVDALRPVIDAARRTDASPIVTVNLWLDRPVVDDEFVGLPGRHMQWVFDKGRMFGESAAHLSLVSSGAGDIVARSNAEIVALAMGELRAALPRVRDAVVKRAVTVREKRATFSLAPGQPPRPATTTGVAGLFLAGDWIDTGLPATIESAVMSGHRAAAAVLDYLDNKPGSSA